MRIILNADDFGASADTVAATSECLLSGALTSATIMVRMPASQAAIEFARTHPEFSYGVHLTFVSDGVEAPVVQAPLIPQLCASDGKFRGSNTIRLLGMLRQLSVDQIATEMTAQLAFLRDHGVQISHVDSHGHTHKFAPFRQALRQVLPRFAIRRVRGVQDIYIRRPLKSPTFWLGRYFRRQMADFNSPDHFYMPTTAGDQGFTGELLASLAMFGRDASIEVGVHPGEEEAWRRQEMMDIQEFAYRAHSAGHKLIGWNSL